jgi:hypothetical protein
VFAAVKQVTVREVRLLMPLETLRGLPSLFARRPAFRPAHSAPLLDEFIPVVVPLGERPDAEIAEGTVGRFWRPAGNGSASVPTREDFASFAEPGYTKAAIAFLVRLEGGGSGAITETRKSWLAAIRRRAVRADQRKEETRAADTARARSPQTDSRP